MAALTDVIGRADSSEIREIFRSRLLRTVPLILFVRRKNEAKGTALKLMRELVALTDRLDLQVLSLEEDQERATELGVVRAPTLIVVAGAGSNVRYLGTPGGRQLGALIEDIVEVSSGGTPMEEGVRAMIRSIDRALTIRVFVTQFCPYSPMAVRSAHRFAMLNPLITAEMVETVEFPELAQEYGVVGVPTTFIGDVRFDGYPGEEAFARRVVEACRRTAS